jgi:surfactin synthase thioesterase subunit
MLAYLMTAELARRGAPPPAALVVSGRAPPHYVKYAPAEGKLSQQAMLHAMGDEAVLDYSTSAMDLAKFALKETAVREGRLPIVAARWRTGTSACSAPQHTRISLCPPSAAPLHCERRTLATPVHAQPSTR